MKAALAALLLLSASALHAAPLTIRSGETWIFTIRAGEPAEARKVPTSAKPARGEIKASVAPLMGTTMTISNNSPVAYTFSARLVGADGKEIAARTCTLPAGGRPSFENWRQKASAVRIGGFEPTDAQGRC